MPKLSIIVPVYNVEPFLRRCLDSILSQNYKDFEVIVIDDGSPDNCGAIIDEYARQDDRIIAIHQQNKGVSAARNAGLRIARGEYVGFVDPDDWLDGFNYSKMIQYTEQFDVEIICSGWIDAIQHQYTQHLVTDTVCILDGKSFAEKIFDMPRTIVGSTCLMNKIFKRDLIERGFDESICVYEDAKFLIHYCKKIVRALLIPEYTCYKYHRDESLSHQGSNADYLYVRRGFIIEANEISNKCRNKAEAEYLDACFYYLSLLSQDNKTTQQIMVANQIKSYLCGNWPTVVINDSISWKTKICYGKWLVCKARNPITPTNYNQ